MDIDMEIREAQANDRGDIVEFIYSAAPQLYDFLFNYKGYSAKDFLRFEFLSGSGYAGYKNVTVAVSGDEVVGTGCFYDGKDHGKLFMGTAMNILRFYKMSCMPIFLRSMHIESVMKRPKRDELYLSNFGVSAKMRGQGIGTKMIEYVLASVKDKNYRIFSLDVSVTNPKAEALYSRLGLKVVEEKKFSAKGSNVPNVKKMELVL